MNKFGFVCSFGLLLLHSKVLVLVQCVQQESGSGGSGSGGPGSGRVQQEAWSGYLAPDLWGQRFLLPAAP